VKEALYMVEVIYQKVISPVEIDEVCQNTENYYFDIRKVVLDLCSQLKIRQRISPLKM
jgi:hypothetical protein